MCFGLLRLVRERLHKSANVLDYMFVPSWHARFEEFICHRTISSSVYIYIYMHSQTLREVLIYLHIMMLRLPSLIVYIDAILSTIYFVRSMCPSGGFWVMGRGLIILKGSYRERENCIIMHAGCRKLLCFFLFYIALKLWMFAFRIKMYPGT